MITEIIGALLGGGMGGITGLIGTGLAQWGKSRDQAHDLALLQLQHAQTLQLKQADDEQQIKLANLTAASQAHLADINATVRAGETASADYQIAMGADKATYLDAGAQASSPTARVLMALVDFLRGIIRPGATIYSLILLTVLLAWVRDMQARAQLPLSPADARELAMQVIGTATYLATTCTVYWFGVRGQAKK